MRRIRKNQDIMTWSYSMRLVTTSTESLQQTVLWVSSHPPRAADSNNATTPSRVYISSASGDFLSPGSDRLVDESFALSGVTVSMRFKSLDSKLIGNG